MHIWRELLRLSSELLEQSGHAAIDDTSTADRPQLTTSNAVIGKYKRYK